MGKDTDDRCGETRPLEPEVFIRSGTGEFRRVGLSMVAAGFSTFSLMNCVQPLMPIFSADFDIDAPEASLSLSVTIGALAVALLFTAPLSDRFGRKPVMTISLFISSVLLLVSATAQDWHWFLLLRALQGLAFSGLPAVAMAYLSEEIDPRRTGYAVGLYVAGAAFGGMGGRVIAAFFAELAGWRLAIAAIGVIGLVAACVFAVVLPKSRHFSPRRSTALGLLRSYYRTISDPVQRLLGLIAFLLMGSLIAVYNYLGYRLLTAPFGLSHTLVGLLFTVYLSGIGSSIVVGRLADRFGRPRILIVSVIISLAGVVMMGVDHLVTIISGLIVFTVGFFGAHAVASGWAGRAAPALKAQASAIYLVCYYLGGAMIGWLGGYFWEAFEWPGITSTIGVCLLVALFAAARLARLAKITSGTP